ncbi:hypothetical protein DFH28DRAFT_1070114 [Melampsora americana]|nr:hypothetical protein DFH28DRAFT_1070114 [Melampsora americana]
MSILTLTHHSNQTASTSRLPFFEPNRITHPARSTISHPQLRDLLICPDQAHHVQTISGNGVDTHLLGQYTMSLMDVPTSFSPNCLVHGCGMMAMGGENADLLIRSTDITSKWEIKTHTGQSIVNSACFHQFYPTLNPQLLVCNNDQTITQYDLSKVSEIQSSAHHSLSVDPSHQLPNPSFITSTRSNRLGSFDDDDHQEGFRSDEKPILTHKGSIHLPVPVNHCSISPNSRSMVAVGDSNEVFLYECSSTTDLISSWTSKKQKIHLPGILPSTGSFSTSWNQTSDKFAIASEGEIVVVFDIKMLGKPILIKKTHQTGRAGAARVVKFTPEGPNELLAFTEHRSLVHVIDARTFDSNHDETLIVPNQFINPHPIRLPPGTIRPVRSTDHRLIQAWMRGSTSVRSRGEGEVRIVSEQEEEEEEEEEGGAEGEERVRQRTLRGSLPELTHLGERERRRSEGANGMEERLWGEVRESESADASAHAHVREESGYRSLVRRANRLATSSARDERNGRWSGIGGLRNNSNGHSGHHLRIGFPASSSSLNSERNQRENRVEGNGEEEEEEEDCIIIQEAGADFDLFDQTERERLRERERSRERSSERSIERERNRESESSSSTSSHLNLITRSHQSTPTTTRRIQIGGSSVRMLNFPERTHELYPLPSVARAGTGTRTRNGSVNELIRGLTQTNGNLSWMNGSGGTGGLIMEGFPAAHQDHPEEVRSGRWDDLIGICWDSEGEWLCSGTELGLVEWKVKRSYRTGFGDSRLC